MKTNRIDWIAADWGTSNLRCWAMSRDHHLQDQAESDQGMSSITAAGGDFESALLQLIQPWLKPGSTIPVMACGMLGAKGGWLEVPYKSTPCSAQTSVTRIPTRSPQIDVFVHAGVRQNHPADVMRGEETQISGFLSRHPDFSGLLCLPGTHTKWVRLSDGDIHSFRTFMSGELFTLLSKQSVLRHTVAPDGWNDTAFIDAVRASLAAPASMLHECFRLRAEALLNGLDGIDARSRLSGLLVGLELSGALDEDSNDHPVIIIGSPTLSKVYRTALESVGVPVECLSAETCVLDGLAQSFTQLRSS